MVPTATTVAVLINPNYSPAQNELRDAQAAAARLGLQLVVLRANTESEFAGAFADLTQQRAGALLVSASPFFFSRRAQIVALAARQAVPTIYEWREFAVAGGLMSYGTNINDAYRQMGVYAGRILKGEKPADLPVVQSTRFEFVINLSTAKALGIEVPPTLSARGLTSGGGGFLRPPKCVARVEAVLRSSRRLPGSPARRSIAARTILMGKRWQRGGFVASVAGAVRFARTTPSSSRRSSAWSSPPRWAIPCDP